MIQEVKMYQAVCDGCGKSCTEDGGIIAWESPESARYTAVESGWFAVNHNLYCPDCVVWDKETKSYKPKKTKTYDK